jgi:transposase InsO family protein
MDTCKIGPGIYQYTAVDDCSRWRVLEIYKRRTANNTLQFLDTLMAEFPFAIQRIQTDRGLEFFAEKVQQKLMSLSIKFRPNKPASPHLNGKVERSQKTDLEEFYAVTDLSDFEKLKEQLSEWQFFYNWQRPHGSLGGKTPSQIVGDLSEKALLTEAVLKNYDIKNERIQIANYQHDLAIRKLKGSL